VTYTGGPVVGSIVNVTGTMATRIISGQPSERTVNLPTITNLGYPISPVQPLSMKSSALGGETNGLIKGVAGGTGLNSLGLLVRYTGRVTMVLASTIFVDDGGGIIDPIGETGVLVKCPTSSPPVVAGDMVKVTGEWWVVFHPATLPIAGRFRFETMPTL
ncbi:MAG: hypothetical protein WCL39_11365, partial [Armatimonadota bacterium]